MKISENIELEHNVKRGYGRCDRLYIWDEKGDGSKGYKAVDIGEAWNEYQHSVHPVDGEFEKIADYLKTIPVSVIRKFMEKFAVSSCCSIYPLFNFEKLKQVCRSIGQSPNLI